MVKRSLKIDTCQKQSRNSQKMPSYFGNHKFNFEIMDLNAFEKVVLNSLCKIYTDNFYGNP